MAGPGFTSLFGGTNIYQADPSFLSLNPLTANIALSWPIEQSFATPNVADIIEVSASTPGLIISLDDATQTTEGYTTLFNNIGADTFEVQDILGNTLLTVASGEVWQIYLADNTTPQGTWRVFQYGAGASNANAAALAGAGLVAIGTKLNETMFVDAVNTNQVLDGTSLAQVVQWTGGVGTIELPSAVTVATNWFMSLKNSGTGNVTVTAAAGNIDGSAQLIMPPESSTFIVSDGANFFTVGLGQDINSVFDFIQIDLTGDVGNVVLAGAQLNRISYKFTGALAGNVTIVLPGIIQQYWVDNETTGPFTLTFSTTAVGAGTVTVLEGNREILYCDSVNVLLANTGGSVTFGNGTAAAPSVTFTNDQTTGLFFTAPHTLDFATQGVLRGSIDGAGHWVIEFPDDDTLPALTINGATTGATHPAVLVAAEIQTAVAPALAITNPASGGFGLFSIGSSNSVLGTSDFSLFQLPSNDCTILVRAAQALNLGTNGLSRVVIDSQGHVVINQPDTGGSGISLEVVAPTGTGIILTLSGTSSTNPAFSYTGITTTGAVAPALTANKPGASGAIFAWVPVLVNGTPGWQPVWSN